MTKKKTLEQEVASAKKAADKAAGKLKTLEARFLKKNTPKVSKPIYERVTTLTQVYKHLKVDQKKDVIKVDGFDKEDNKVLEGIIERIRITKVYNEGKVPKRGDQRWYPWHDLKAGGSGLVFDFSADNDDYASTSSAARLSFLKKLSTDSYARNFMATEEKIIGL